jgi:hypothetical protein
MAHFLVRLAHAKPERMTPSLVRDHVAWLFELSRKGVLILCGPVVMELRFSSLNARRKKMPRGSQEATRSPERMLTESVQL